MIRTVIEVDLKKRAQDQWKVLHNRWHPDIPSVATVKPGETFKVQCLDWSGKLTTVFLKHTFCIKSHRQSRLGPK